MEQKENDINLEQIHQDIISVRNKLPGHWKGLWNGILTGIGSVIGVALAILIIGFILNVIGVIPSFKNEVDSWKGILQETQNYRANILQK